MHACRAMNAPAWLSTGSDARKLMLASTAAVLLVAPVDADDGDYGYVKSRKKLEKRIESWIQDPRSAEAKFGPLADWDVSRVTDMSGYYDSDTNTADGFLPSTFNGDVSNWDVSQVTDMNHMFCRADSFAGDVSNWDVSRVTDMNSMFYDASSFAGDVSNWDVSRVTDMSDMFYDASSFAGDVSKWDVSQVTEMSDMFYDASSFAGDVSNWDVSQVTDMYGMFFYASSFAGDVSNWDVSQVTDMSGMFGGASSFAGDVSNWDVSQVTDMSEMFHVASSFAGDVSNWDVSQVTNMSSMFYGASSFAGDVSNWDVSQVTDMSYMFYVASSFAGDVSNWDVSRVTDMSFMFADSGFSGDVRGWQATKVQSTGSMFEGTAVPDTMLDLCWVQGIPCPWLQLDFRGGRADEDLRGDSAVVDVADPTADYPYRVGTTYRIAPLKVTAADPNATLSYRLDNAPPGLYIRSDTGVVLGTFTAEDVAKSPLHATLVASDTISGDYKEVQEYMFHVTTNGTLQLDMAEPSTDDDYTILNETIIEDGRLSVGTGRVAVGDPVQYAPPNPKITTLVSAGS